VIHDLHKKVYAAARQLCAFEMSGWTVTLAGEAGAKLQDQIGTAAAATLIYLVSDPNLQIIPDFRASNEDAMADMKRLADA
jgi:hypothetical protein